MATVQPNIKPSTIDEDIKKTQELLDKEVAEDTPPAPSEEPPEETPTETTEEASEETSEEPVDEDEQDDTPPEKSETDFRKLYNQSSKEALALAAKTKKYEQISEIAAPTEDELKTEYPEWEDMSATERKLASQVLWDKKRFEVIDQINKESKDVDKWNEKVTAFVADPKTLVNNPELEGKVDDFVTFATKPTRRGVDMEDLILAFLGDFAKNRPGPHKGKMFETGSAGGNNRTVKPKDDKISPEEAARLMTTDYKKYKQYLMDGKIRYE